jgi:hypothetical protein
MLPPVPKRISDCTLLTDSNATTQAKALTEKTFVTFVSLVVRNTDQGFHKAGLSDEIDHGFNVFLVS